MTQQDTQPPAETLAVKTLCWSEPHPSHSYSNWTARDANIMFEARIDTSRPLKYGKFPLSINGDMVADKFETVEAAKAYAQRNYAQRILAALTRRAGGDAIPAGMKSWHGGDTAPVDWDGTDNVLLRDRKNWSVCAEDWRHTGDAGDIIAYTPKPPAGGDAGAVRERIARIIDDEAMAGGMSSGGKPFRGSARESAALNKADRILASLALPAPVAEDVYVGLVKAAYLEGLHTGPDGGQEEYEEEAWMESRAFAALSEGRSHG